MVSEYFTVSTVGNFLACPKKYNWGNAKNLTKNTQGVSPLNIGSATHEAMAYVWETHFKRGNHSTQDDVVTAIEYGLDLYDSENRPEFMEQHTLQTEVGEVTIGSEDDARIQWVSMLDDVFSLLHHFFNVHDINRYEVVTDSDGDPLIERRMAYRGAVYRGRRKDIRGTCDLVLRDRETGLVVLVDWKTRRAFKSHRDEFLSFQLPVYSALLEQLYGVRVHTGLIWQIKSSAPKIPSVTKSGATSRQNINTTWDIYSAAVIANGEDPEDYLDMKEKLCNNTFCEDISVELTPLVRQRMTQMFMQAVERIIDAEEDDVHDMSIGYQCNFCQFAPLCESEISGYDTEELIKLAYVQKPDRYEGVDSD